MTIARRLMLLLAVPLVILVALGVLSLVEFARIESRSRFVAEYQIGSLAALGNITRLHGELRVAVRNFLLSADPEERRSAREAFESSNLEISRRLDEYARALVSDERDRELMAEYRKAMEDWNAAARQVMASAEPGRRDEAAAALLRGPARELGKRLGESSQKWIRHNEDLAARSSQLLLRGVAAARRDTLLAVAPP
jgi:methyl-accepting chemotaxis protein